MVIQWRQCHSRTQTRDRRESSLARVSAAALAMALYVPHTKSIPEALLSPAMFYYIQNR